jgi:hypothetical protein
MEVHHCPDILSGFVDGLMHGGLRDLLFKINHKEILTLHKGRALPRHEKHFLSPVNPRTEVGKGVTQSLVVDNPQSGNKVLFQRFQGSLLHNLSLRAPYYLDLKKTPVP